jgi:transcriptional regulator of acetoin/glycerol metabolism
MLISSEERLNRARAVLERGTAAPDGLLARDIAASWNRCLERGLDPRRPPPLRVVDSAVLRAARQQADPLRSLALAEMENLYQQIAGSNFMIAFANASGLLLDTIADDSFRATARTASIQPGTLWTEADCGTNALGTVAALGRKLSVHGGEHFFHRHGDLTCTAAPVFGPDGTLAGVLDASSDCRSRQEHTQALVAMAATQIENGLFREHNRGGVILAFHSRAEYLHTLSAGLLALDAGGRVLGANPQARFLLQGLPVTPGRAFGEIFRQGFASFIDAARREPRTALQDLVGSVFVASLENPRALAAPAPKRVAGVVSPPFVADDPAVAATLRQVAAAARRGLPVLIRGETGAGKEQVARHAHAASGRTGAFVPVNCAALPDGLIEAELFGHADGAFTGARRGGAPGLAVQADGGTLFLDEIGDMPPALQGVLLRLLDDWMVRPVGGGAARHVDVLLVAATNADLAQAIAAQRFRADLYYRLGALEAVLPPLRARSDLAALVQHMLAELAPGWRIEAEAMAALAAHGWPGNIRELRHVLTRLTLAETPGRITATDVAAALGPAAEAPPASLRALTTARIVAAHREAGGNLSATARRLGVSRNTVYRALCKPSG